MNKGSAHAGPSFVLDYGHVTSYPRFARAALLIATSLHLLLGAAVLGFALVHFGTNAREKYWRGMRHAIAAGVLAMFLFAAGFSLFTRNDRGWRRAFLLLIAGGTANLTMMAYWSQMLWDNRNNYLNDNWVAVVVLCALCATVSLGGAYIMCLSSAMFGVAELKMKWRKRICVIGLLLCWILLGFTMKVVISMSHV